MARAERPAGFTEFSIEGTRVVCAPHVAAAMRDVLARGTLYDYAARHPETRALAGRGTAYAAPLPDDADHVVVRHNRHGGLLAPLTGDVFLAPTRAPLELATTERLRAAGVPVPVFLGFVTYPVWSGFARADVMTREVPQAFDLSAALMSDDSRARAEALTAAAVVIAALARAGGFHEDLNIKNVLLHRAGGHLDAVLLDVDRVRFPDHFPHLARNLARFRRSALKWRTRHGARVTYAELDAFERAARSASS
ncbi:MAG TPA: lipopolysaccharide kinase InaA family protein [Gemmatimonadaceae bacterium]|jgi:tRNA A-37 threonylcarbamoyl transferase component Bud32|nr:lipopolysaccharide kinase InaA family protein [Gemmatimonadaceae bacterium]